MNVLLTWKDPVMPAGKSVSRLLVSASVDGGKTPDVIAVVQPDEQRLAIQDVPRGTWQYDVQCLDEQSLPYPKASVSITV